ncbi:Peptodoglycan polymerase FtsW/RodA/SpoVE (FtsW) (PDB:6BAR) (PUBMED:30692671) [Commensalibacter communis]|uniref:Probable peptidoglycan glycosyltransferase FtsW n=1 Tax=Commensalibacter communis TaxID=2972786 RepID=A0A9W4TJP5_9PROT|nr:putative peptidoglycan glycosyltransferase FtsW [Commensalibacter communis]CAI3922253.1 Peptodoglycan polymerase FtsW/RodA/SpoVE (FtsW) (PDB:6BAR) (PUBMED:30692671) [Commensalibacter communis]CAI3923306.1 Peptodoglycan polymerase FtsW/RodA/SpoVE (FtsW) (PDB:6BAR) (PUBMED:30692671) [Commensalibacter communis]CAI3923374.1 Peptodoglycan polymerase FtsW/RodA/SpoVE (FtsW) (PDB:6BAR) (PUBMED:30692671) [Commensalibacter communis]CAI3923559.1 Peptodoglycan polymerase FtsW/RodA/SpoVE (FtsW) (PDB:6BAR
MSGISRSDNSLLARWWRNIDHWMLGSVGLLIGFGYILMMAASPAVAQRIGASRDVFIFKQVMFLSIAALTIIFISMLSTQTIKKLSIVGTFIAILATAYTLVHGMDIKGAKRWIALPIMSLQPSEFLKPCFAICTAWLLTEWKKRFYIPGIFIALGVYAVILFILKSQPDIGMLAVITAVLLTQLFINGLNMFWIFSGLGGMIAAFVGAYVVLPHVRSRVERFLHPEVGDHYQIDTALRAFGNGGLWGRGPGEGRVKDLLPDAHADFVFAVAGEEYGMIICCLIIFIFCFIVVRTLLKLIKEDDPFIILAASGLITGFGLQAFINMGSTLHLIPTKGMTLPFISYGGSSALSIALTIGMVLALTRRRIEAPQFFKNNNQPFSKRSILR